MRDDGQPRMIASSPQRLHIHYLDGGTAGKQHLILLHGIASVATTSTTSRRISARGFT